MTPPAGDRDAEARIAEHRTARAELTFTDASGAPLAGAKARVRLVRHEFKLGCNAFGLFAASDPGVQRAYDDAFAAIMNYATLPFYWGSYEPERDRPQRDRLERMADWCAERGIATKGHPLVWHEVFPKWAAGLPDDEVLARAEARTRELVAGFRGRVDRWDVVNEATVSARFDNAVGRWIKARGAAACVGDALRWARAAGPHAGLLYNDFNVSPEFEALIEALRGAGAPVDAVGIQSHMHVRPWTAARVREVCDAYARFGLPLHFTELTVLSGRPKDPDERDWHKVHADWRSTPEGEAAQLEAGRAVYTELFAHPAVEAVTWWDFSDLRAWQGAPAGLVRQDMSPKPLCAWLVESFGKRWTTRVEAPADAAGRVSARCFFGDHEAELALPSGAVARGTFTLSRTGSRALAVRCG